MAEQTDHRTTVNWIGEAAESVWAARGNCWSYRLRMALAGGASLPSQLRRWHIRWLAALPSFSCGILSGGHVRRDNVLWFSDAVFHVFPLFFLFSSHAFPMRFLCFSFAFLKRFMCFSFAFSLLFLCFSCVCVSDAFHVLFLCFSSAFPTVFFCAFLMFFLYFSYAFPVFPLFFPKLFLCFSCAFPMFFQCFSKSMGKA